MERTIAFQDKIEEHQLAEKVEHKYGFDALRCEQYVKYLKNRELCIKEIDIWDTKEITF